MVVPKSVIVTRGKKDRKTEEGRVVKGRNLEGRGRRVIVYKGRNNIRLFKRTKGNN